MSQVVFHKLEDYLWSTDVKEQKHNHTREVETAAELADAGDPYAPYPPASPATSQQFRGTPFSSGYGDTFAESSQVLPLVANISPFQHADLYEEDYDEKKSLRSKDHDSHSRFTSMLDDTNSNLVHNPTCHPRTCFKMLTEKASSITRPLPGKSKVKPLRLWRRVLCTIDMPRMQQRSMEPEI